MNTQKEIESAVSELKSRFVKLKSSDNEIFHSIVDPRDGVISRFRPVFSSESVFEITEQEFKEFLLFDNNKHWSGLHRMGSKICSDMHALREALKILVDENQGIESRLDYVAGSINGMGKAITTAILLVTYPDKYGVWNNTSEGALKILNVWPKFERGESFGKRYLKINKLLLEIAQKTELDLWTLDALWWTIRSDNDTEDKETLKALKDTATTSEEAQRFGLERYLHEFLRDNWNHLSLGKEWAIYSEPGDDEAGYEYPCSIGRIDLLAKHRKEPRWLVVELKRNQSSDKTVGQALRYIGWVEENLAESSESVEGLIIAHQANESIRYALKTLSNVRLQLYEVEFRLRPYK
ncbi:MAG: endonuclease NucS [Thermotogota bacterium]|nr:endonuclease NucS [Thermotogota bacterium]